MIVALYVLLALIGLCALDAAVTFYLVAVRWPGRAIPLKMALGPKLWDRYRDKIEAEEDWLLSQNRERVELRAYDGVRLAGEFIPGAENSKTAILLMHGYRADAYANYSCAVRFYHDLGLHVLLAHERAHGQSGGSRITFGVRERMDCRLWAEHLAGRLGEDGEILLSGASMGATTVLMAAGLELPKQVRGVIADSGFTSPREVFRAVLKQRRVPLADAYLALFAPLLKLLGGFDIDCSTLDAMRKGKLPVLLIHGDADRMVPWEMSRQNRDACAAACRFLLIPGAGHCLSYLTDTERCQREILYFIEKYTSIRGQKPESPELFQPDYRHKIDGDCNGH